MVRASGEYLAKKSGLSALSCCARSRRVRSGALKARWHYAIPADLLGTMMKLARSYLEIKSRKEAEKEATFLEGKTRRSRAPQTPEDEPVSTDDPGLLSPSILGGA
jgi:hypothetical protein